MYIKNTTKTFLSLDLGKNHYLLDPDGVLCVSEEDSKTSEYAALEGSGRVSVISEEDGRAFMLKKDLAMNMPTQQPITLNTNSQDKSNNIMLAECGAILANGRRCGANVNVPALAYDKDALYFCNQHEGENKDDYVFADGKWSKKAPEPVNPPTDTAANAESTPETPVETTEKPADAPVDDKADTASEVPVETAEKAEEPAVDTIPSTPAEGTPEAVPAADAAADKKE